MASSRSLRPVSVFELYINIYLGLRFCLHSFHVLLTEGSNILLFCLLLLFVPAYSFFCQKGIVAKGCRLKNKTRV